MSATILFLPRSDEDEWRWLRVADDAVADRGEGLPTIDPAEDVVTAIAPADAVTLHWAELPDRSAAQSVAAARILVAEASATPIGELHVAVGRESDSDDRPIGVVANARMARWLASLGGVGIDPAAIVPAPMLLPRPDEGYVRADLGTGGAVRGRASGFADEGGLTEFITGGVTPDSIELEALEQAIVAAVAAPALDLRQGAFARRTRRAIDWRLVQRLAALAGMILAVTLLIDLVRIAKYNLDATALDARAASVARTGLPRGAAAGDPDRLLAERLSRLRGPGLGFSRTAAIVFAAVRQVGGSEVTRVDFDANGDLRVGLATDGEAQANAVKQAIEAANLSVESSPFQANGARLSGELTVRAP